MTALELAQRLGITKSLVERWIRQGKIATDRIGRMYVIPAAEAERFIAAYRPRKRPPPP